MPPFLSSLAGRAREGIGTRFSEGKLYRVIRYRDFRLLWIGAFLTFAGSWVQNVAQGYLVFEMTGNEAKLGLVTFVWSAPVAIFGLVSGTLADTLDKRRVLIFATLLFASTALFLAIATTFGFVQFWHILLIAAINGTVASVEMPTRQSVLSRVVPAEDLAAAIPLQAMTFNLARVVGSAIGGLLLARMSVQACYFVNAASFFALIYATVGIRADLSAEKRKSQPIGDLLFEGVRYTLQDRRLRTLFLMEAATASFGLAYTALMPALTKKMLGLGGAGLGTAWTFVGIGALSALLLNMSLAHRPFKGVIVRVAMIAMGLGLVLLSSTTIPALAYPLLSVVGAASIMQFNTTNTLFQLLAPERLRGRVIAMHIWAISGLGPIGTLLFSWIASETSVAYSLRVGGIAVLLSAALAMAYRKGLEGVE